MRGRFYNHTQSYFPLYFSLWRGFVFLWSNAYSLMWATGCVHDKSDTICSKRNERPLFAIRAFLSVSFLSASRLVRGVGSFLVARPHSFVLPPSVFAPHYPAVFCSGDNSKWSESVFKETSGLTKNWEWKMSFKKKKKIWWWMWYPVYLQMSSGKEYMSTILNTATFTWTVVLEYKLQYSDTSMTQ